MKSFSVMAVCLFVLLVPGSKIKAQNTVVAFDTIHLTQAEYYSDDFTLQDSLISTISIQKKALVQMNDVHFKLGGNIMGGLATIVTGIGFNSVNNVDWYLASTIRTSNPKLDWIFDVYCPGYIEKERTRVKNEDGSKSVETNYVNHFSWHQGAIGYLIEAGDTIGWHYVSRFPRTDSAVLKWSQTLYKGLQDKPGTNFREFALVGKFTGNESSIIYNVNDNRIYIFSGNDLSGMYQCQKPPQFKLSKKKRKPFQQPYLLVNTRLTPWERMDILRLAMEGLRMKNAIESF